jgi:hypothetical protein
MAVIVVYGGGFQPFHAGHLSSYLEAKQQFSDADFYVAASNDTKTRPIPFKDKQFLAQQAGVIDKFTEVKLPIRPTEILDRYNPNKDIFILVRSERDPVGYTKKDGSPGYYQPFVSIANCQPFGHNGYVFVTHKKEFKLNGQVVYSGTQVRDMYAGADERGRQIIVKQLYPQSKQQGTIKQMLDKYIGAVAEPIEKPVKGAINKLKANKLKEQIQRMRPLIREASIEQKYKFLKLMKEAAQLNELNLFRRKEEPIKSEPRNSPNDYRGYFTKQTKPAQKVYRSPDEYYANTKIDPLKAKEPVKEGPTSDMRDFFKTQQPLNTAPIKPGNIGPTIATVTRQGESMAEVTTKDELEELANTSLKVKEPKDFVNVNDRKQVTYKVMKFKSGKDTYLINFTVKGPPAFGKKQNWNAVNVAFGVREEQDDYSFGDEINTDLTAKNKKQFLIYSTVINAIRKFITEYNTEIDEIIMQGAGERQVMMYQRFFRVASKYFPGWHYDGKHSLVRDVPRQTGKKVKEQGVFEDYLPEK